MHGRGDEQARLRVVIEHARHGRPESLILRGEPGIGKSTLLTELCQSLDDALVITATGMESERHLPLGGLIEMLHPLRGWFDSFDSPHREVLEGAIDRGDAATPLALGLAVLHCLVVLDTHHPAIVIVLDDVHWVDDVSVASIRFAFRRLTDERVALLLAARSGEFTDVTGIPEIDIGGVDDEASREILSAGGDVTLAVAATARSMCGGNPLALQELERIMTPAQRRGAVALPDPIPMGARLTSILQARVGELPDATQRALVVLALAGPTDRVGMAAVYQSLGASTEDLTPAEQCGIVVHEPGGFAFSHPLLRAAVLGQSDAVLRREAHRALAAALPPDDVEGRAHHLDLSSEGPDPDAADLLEQVAIRAVQRCAHEIAAHAWERAARHSSTRAEEARRLGEAAGALWRANRPDLGIPVAEQAWALAGPGITRASITSYLGDMLTFWRDAPSGVQLLIDEARSVEAESPAVAAGLMGAAASLMPLRGDFKHAVDLSVAAEQIAQRAGGDVEIFCRALGTHLRLLHGEIRELDERLPELDLIASFVGPGTPEELVALGQMILFDYLTLGRWDSAQELATRVVVEARRFGLRGIEIFSHAIRGEVAWRTGRWIEARAESLIEIRHNEDCDEPVSSFGQATLARVEAALGLVESSQQNATLAIEQGQRVSLGALEAWGRHAFALALIADDDYAGALVHLEWIAQLCRQGQINEPGVLWWHGDLVEAQWRAGRVGDLDRFATQMGIDAERTGSQWAAAVAARGRGLSRLDVGPLLESALLLDGIDAPFEAARSRGLIGEIADPTAHRAVLQQALDAFDRLGATPWTKRTSALLGGTPATGPNSSAVIGVLSKSELRVALAVARGMTNRAAADSLYLSPKTVDSHLQHIYRKLDVASRTELALLINRSVGAPSTH